MKAVWKFPLTNFAMMEQTIDMPYNADILCVQMQDGVPTLWALVDPASAPFPKTFRVVGTGHHEVPTNAKYIGTFQKDWFVGHVFELQ